MRSIAGRSADRFLRIGKFVASLLIASAEALAQQVPRDLPPTTLPGVRLPQLPTEPPPALAPEILVPETAPTRLPPGADTVRFVLQSLTIEGVTAYSPAFFERFYKNLIGKDVTLAQIYEVRAEIEKAYRKDGYFLTRVIVPPQTVQDGRFRVQVLEGYVDGVEFEGDIGSVRERVRAYVERVVGRRPLQVKTLERYLLLANDIPGVNVQGVLRPSPTTVGAAQLVVRQDRKPFDALLVVDNLGNEYTGLWQTAATVASNAFTPFGERVAVTGLVSDPANGFNHNKNEWVVQGQTSWRFGVEGLFTEALVSYGRSKPGFVVRDFDFNSNTLLVSTNVGYPFVRSRDISVTGLVGFDFVNTDTDIFGGDSYSRDRLRILHITGRATARDAWKGENEGTISLRQGVDLFDATTKGQSKKSRPDGSSLETVLRGTLSRSQPVYSRADVLGRPAGLGLYGVVAGQYSPNSLLSDELFDLGGTQFGRGYDYGEVSGDSGLGFSGEAQFTHRLGLRYLQSYQLFAFYDYGRVWNHTGGGSEALSSAGGGVRAAPTETFSLEFVVAKPLTQDSERSSFGREPQLLFRAVARY